MEQGMGSGSCSRGLHGKSRASPQKGSTCLEIGCGLGVSGIGVAGFGHRYVI